ncbi:MAG: transposase, partial [Candidatus Acidiferrales bacterium]
MRNDNKHRLTKSEVVKNIPLACWDELAAVELLERLRWGRNPACVNCGSVSVYKMVDAKTGARSQRFLWRCHDCHKQYT